MNPTYESTTLSALGGASQTGTGGESQISLALRQLGRQLIQAGRLDEAHESLALCAELWPASPQRDTRGQAECLFDLANALYAGGRFEEAIGEYRRVVRLDPRLAPAWYNLGVALMQTASPKADEPWKDAEHAYRRALKFQPHYPEAHNNLGILLQSRQRPKEAMHHYRCATALDAQFVEPRFNLGTLLLDEGKLEEARRVFEALLENAPGHVDARNNLANVLSELRQYDLARVQLEEAQRVSPCNALTGWNLGLNQLRCGDWAAGWRNYEWRLRQAGSADVPRSRRPLWDGSPLNGSRILLTAEQGLGDMLQFMRFTKHVAARGGRVWLECHRPLESLLSRVPELEGVTVIGNPLPEHDCWLPLLSLPHVLGTTVETLPSEVPYLSAQAERIGYWRERLRPWQGIRAGVAWTGNPGLRINQKRSLDDRDLRGLVETLSRDDHGAPVHIFNLQKGIAAPKNSGLIPLDHDGSSMEDLAGVLMNLDVVVSVDTSVAHLAGALGRTVWTILPFHGDWRWMTPDRTNSPWYPTMRIFRQAKAGDWSSVLTEISEALRTGMLEGRS